MGFIERLRQEKDATAQLAQQLRASEIASGETRKQAEAQARARERELHQQRRQQANSFAQESGIINLLGEFRRIIGGEEESLSVNLRRDEDSILLTTSWAYKIYYSTYDYSGRRVLTTKVINTRVEAGSEMTPNSGSFKYLAAEFCPDGTIVFYHTKKVNTLLGSKKIVPIETTIAEIEWRNNPAILENTLEEAYNNPRAYSWEYKAANLLKRARENATLTPEYDEFRRGFPH